MSLRLRLLILALRLLAKPLFRHTRSAWPVRVGMVLAALVLPLPFGVTARREPGAAARVHFAPRSQIDPSAAVLVWFHGGAYVSGSAFTHRGMLGRIARAGGICLVAPDYRLAPEHPAPAAFDDALAVIAELGLPPGQIILGGDSAGGGLAAAVCAHLCARGQVPLGMVLLSPWTDLTLSGASLSANARRDPMLPSAAMPEAVRQIRGALDPADPRISPLFADWPQACPTLIQVGTSEVLLDDALRLAGVLRGAGAKVTLEQLPGAPHVLAWFAPWIPESVRATRRIGGFIRSLLPPPPAGN